MLQFLFSVTVIILSLSTHSDAIRSSHVLKKSRCPVQWDVEGHKCTETTHISLSRVLGKKSNSFVFNGSHLNILVQMFSQINFDLV